MKVLHIESGLGNQRLSYCEYLALKKANPKDEFYLETIAYDIPECNDTICQWNGYELNRIFGIKEPANIRDVISELQWNDLIAHIRASEFWRHNWNYPVAFTNAFKAIGIDLENIRGDFDPDNSIITGRRGGNYFVNLLKDSRLCYELKRRVKQYKAKSYLSVFDKRSVLFYHTDKSLFTGQWLYFKFRGNARELIEDEIRKTFQFPPFVSDRDMEMADFLEKNNTVAIHARRGDMMSAVWWCYKYGYFKRAVKHIRKHVADPVFVFFTNPGSVEWCKNNSHVFGLDFNRDKVCFVDWNSGEDSYRDMQLMGCCKHAIITASSFGWWGAYFIKNPKKITISPCLEIDTTYHC